MTKEELKELKKDYKKLKFDYNNEKDQIIKEKELELEELKEQYKIKRKRLKNPLEAVKYEQKLIKKKENWQKNEPPHRTLLEEIGNSVTHGVGVLLGVYFLTIMLIISNTSLKCVASSIYGVCFILQMLFSCLYHSFRSGSKVKRLFRRFDYSTIYLQLAGTFTPLLLVYTTTRMNNNIIGVSLCAVMWSLMILGIVFVAVFGPGRIKWLHYTLYFVLGWSGLVFIPYWIINKDYWLMLYILLGGVIYSLGMIPFAAFKKKKVAHFIWHFVVLVGAICQFVGIYLYCLPL